MKGFIILTIVHDGDVRNLINVIKEVGVKLANVYVVIDKDHAANKGDYRGKIFVANIQQKRNKTTNMYFYHS